jgi:thiosulfate/3-mercaptopyruvate sulfurtransferase
MKRLRRSIVGMLGVAALSVGAATRVEAAGPLLVEPDWLASRLSDRQVVVLHVGNKAGFDTAHIPGARQIAEDDVARPHDMAKGDLMLELPDAATLRATLAARGISDDSVVVVYAGKDVPLQSATRILFTLDYVGLGGQSSILNGGLAAWQAAGKPTTTDATVVKGGVLTARATSPVVVNAAFVQALGSRPRHTLVDARAPVFYRGTEPTFGKRGHIPGAINIPFTSISDARGRIVVADLKKLFADAGVKPGDTVVAYCHVGQQATAVVLAARLLDIPAVLYDGAFQDWASANRGAVEP